MILDIPLNRRGSDDVRFWTGSKNGMYIVKDGYHFERTSFAPPTCQSVFSNQHWWKIINVPPKIRIFFWCASRDIISTPANLLPHHISIQGICILCKFYRAFTSHSILFCPPVRCIWKKSLFWLCLKDHSYANFVDCAMHVFKLFKIEDFELFVILC